MELHELKEALTQVNPHDVYQISKAMFLYRNGVQDGEQSSAAWKKLFAFYNSTGRRIGMGCRPCFKAVYDFVESHIQKESLKNA